MDGAGDVFGACPEFHGQHAFGDHVGSARADDMHAQNAIGFGMGDQLDKTVLFTHAAGAAGPGKRIGADAIGDLALLDLLLGVLGDVGERLTKYLLIT